MTVKHRARDVALSEVITHIIAHRHVVRDGRELHEDDRDIRWRHEFAHQRFPQHHTHVSEQDIHDVTST